MSGPDRENNSIEHLPDPTAALGKVSKLLIDGGVFVGQVPNWDCTWRRLFPRHWTGLQVPRHLSFFDEGSLRAALEAVGMAVTDVCYAFDPGQLSVSACSWLTERLGLRTRPRQAWFFTPLAVCAAPVVYLDKLLRGKSGELEFVARHA